MTGMALNQAFIPRDYEVFVGLDVDKKSFSATVVDHQIIEPIFTNAQSSGQLVGVCSQAFPRPESGLRIRGGPHGFRAL